MRMPPSPRALIVVGMSAHLLVMLVVMVVGLSEQSPLSVGQRLVDRGGKVVSLGLLPAGLAIVAWQRQAQALLGIAVVMLVPAAFVAAAGLVVTLGGFAFVTSGTGLLVTAGAWVTAIRRFPRRAARWNRNSRAAIGVGVLAALAVAAPTVHSDPACWSFTQDETGQRTYEPAPELVPDRSGFGWPQFAPTRSWATRFDPDRRVTTGWYCLSDRTTGPQAAVATLLAGAALLVAMSHTRRHLDTDADTDEPEPAVTALGETAVESATIASCGDCGSSWRPSYTFCGRCGAPLGAERTR
jgi:hypothetical protein